MQPSVPSLRTFQRRPSHDLGQNFAKAFDTTFTDSENKLVHVWQTSWGVSTRLIGAVIMGHHDEVGLILPPKIAPYQVVIIPILKKNLDNTKVLNQAKLFHKELTDLGQNFAKAFDTTFTDSENKLVHV